MLSDDLITLHKAIHAALATFEKTSGRRINSIGLKHMTIERIGDPSKLVAREVVIDLVPDPPRFTEFA